MGTTCCPAICRRLRRTTRHRILCRRGSFCWGNAGGNYYNFPPLHKKKGAGLERPPLVRQLGTTGEVVLDVVVALDGRVSKVTGIKGPSLLLGATAQAVRSWRFAPVTFLGKPVEVQLRFSVLYGRGD